MGNKNAYVKIKYFFIIFLLTQFSFGQLSSFTLNCTATNETCTGNGALSFNVSGVSSGASIIYTVYKFPNLTSPIATLATSSLGGLTAGDYRVVATQSLGSLTNFQQQDILITNLIEPLTYEIDGNNLGCAIDGTITINILTGSAVSYEIFSGPIIYPLQTSNSFSGLVLGNYQIRVFDNCGDGVVQSFTVFSPVSGGLTISSNNSFSSSNCSTVLVTQTITPSSSLPITYPLNIQYTFFHPLTGSANVFNQVLGSGTYVTQYLPLYPNLFYTYNVKITDACGTIYTNNGNVVNSSVQPKLLINSLNCTQGNFTFAFAQSVTMVGAPSTFSGTLPFIVPESSTEGMFPLANLPVGYYTFNIVDVCGTPISLSYYLSPYSAQEYEVFSRVGCEVGYGSIRIRSNILHYQSFTIIEAPATYSATLPENVSYNIDFSGLNFYMNGLPQGQYVFKLIDECNNEEIVYHYIYGYTETNNISITKNCGSFDINLFHTSNATSAEYFLQKFDSVTNQWVHPITGFAGSSTFVGISNAIPLIGNSINYNFVSTGVFRIVLHKFSYGNSVVYEQCNDVIYSFEYNSDPAINAVYSFECANNLYDVIVDANGTGTLIYRITLKNGNPFLINNGNNPIFLGLEPASYNFQVEDSCGNISNIQYDVPTPFDLEITASNLCNEDNASLSVPLFSFLEYQWWKGDATTTILSTTNSLLFPSFDYGLNSGVYHVRIRYLSNSNSCIDFVLDFTIPPDGNLPNAGLDGEISFCGTQGQLNLFNYLSGTFDANGFWEEVTTSGSVLNSNLWDASSVNFGTYQFKYRVQGLCNNFDESFVEITIYPIPEQPVASVDAVICDGQNLQLYASTIIGSTYQWNGPNGFESTEQNPIIENATYINNGIYTVKTLSNNCESPLASVLVEISIVPKFSITFECVENAAILTAIGLNNSFNTSSATYQWSNSDGFSSTTNPTVITGEKRGIFTLTITNDLGCFTTNSYEVLNTLCFIPKGVSPNADGINDSFDLSGFSNVGNVKIFNRYGMVVYEEDNYIDQWNGQDKKGNLLPSATYFYVVNFDGNETKTGWVYLLREN